LAGYDIGSTANDRVKRLVRLRQRRVRDRERLFPVEEQRVIDRALAAGHEPREVYWCPDLSPARDWAADAVTVSPAVLAKASYRSNPEGVIALFPYLDLRLSRLSASSHPTFLVAEGIEKPGNLGALLRVADAAGLDGVVVVDDLVDPFNPNVVRASTGSLFSVPMATATLEEADHWLSDLGVPSVAAVASGGEAMWDAGLSGPVALWVGTEADGLSKEAVDRADLEVTIPMTGSVDSLNASVSGAILVFEVLRQRRFASGSE
jgi:RNA methyltransferase, TrmH family